jgi:hypothetical protein
MPRSGCKGLFSWNSWSPEPINIQDYSDSLNALKNTEFKRFTDNFIRFNVVPGNVDWFDKEFSSILANASLAGKIARCCDLKGILLDVEHYEGSPFSYSSRPGRSSHSLAEYRSRVEQCGRDFMSALTHDYSDITILLTYGYHLADQADRQREANEYGLLSSFLDGMRKAASPDSLIIDGWEFSYGYRIEEQFKTARDLIYKESGARSISGPLVYRCSFGIWIDNLQVWNRVDFSKNYFTPEGFLASLIFAIKHSDRYVWIYSQQANWWNGEMPIDYLNALSESQIQ